MVLCTRENCIRADVTRPGMETPAREIALYERFGAYYSYGVYAERRG